MQYSDSIHVRSEVFLREDLQAILEAIDMSNGYMASAINTEEVMIFRKGFLCALDALAKACHIDYEMPQDRLPEVLSPERLTTDRRLAVRRVG